VTTGWVLSWGTFGASVGVVSDHDDVENFPNKFTAHYLFLINQTESDLPRVNQPSLDRMRQLNSEWATLKARGVELAEKDIPAFNRRLWDAGIGAIWKDS
jgi:hypothetical protein